jgi:ketosteroid isomerase-like protein
VVACADWFTGSEDAYRAAGVIGPAITTQSDDPLHRFVARLGRDASPHEPLAAVVRFNEAFGRHDLATLAELVTDDVTFVDTTPPDGTAHHGRAAALGAFGSFFEASPTARFETLGGFVADRRVVIRWRYRWGDDAGDHVDGVDLFTVTDGKIAEKLAFVKG